MALFEPTPTRLFFIVTQLRRPSMDDLEIIFLIAILIAIYNKSIVFEAVNA